MTPIRVLMQDIDIKKLLEEDLENLPPDTRKKYKRYLVQLDRKQKHKKITTDFLTFVKHVWPEFIEGYHHKIIAEKFNKLATGEIKSTKEGTQTSIAYTHKTSCLLG